MSRLKIVFVLTVMLFSADASSQIDPIVITMDSRNNSTIYEYDNNQTNLVGLIDMLRTQITKENIKEPVYVLASEKVTISELVNMRGALQKFGFPNIRYFYFGKSRSKMAELMFVGKAVQFTKDPSNIK